MKKLCSPNENGDWTIYGYAVWFTISKMRVPWSIVNSFARESGLPAIPRPEKRSVFERVCNENKEILLVEDAEKRVVLLLRPSEDKARKIILEFSSKEDNSVKYEEYGEIRFENTLIIKRNEKSDLGGLGIEEVIEKIKAQWIKEKECVTEEVIRKLLLKILERAKSIKLKPSGSIYFVHRTKFKDIENFSNFLEKIKSMGYGSSSEFWYAPIGDAKLKKMISIKVKEEFLNDFENVLLEILQKIKSNRMKANEILNTRKKVDELYNGALLYFDLLEEEIEILRKMSKICISLTQCKDFEKAIELLKKESEEVLVRIFERVIERVT